MTNNSFDYMMLDRLKMDVEYWLNHGNQSDSSLYYGDIHKHLAEMQKLLGSFPEDAKPEWLTQADLDNYRAAVLSHCPTPVSEYVKTGTEGLTS